MHIIYSKKRRFLRNTATRRVAFLYFTRVQARKEAVGRFVNLRRVRETQCLFCNYFQLDYAILHQLLLENDVALHILMKGDFVVQKSEHNRTGTVVFGKFLKSTLAYG